MGIHITLQRYDVQVLGRMFQFVGQMEPAGRLLDYLNKGRTTFPLYDVEISPIKSGPPLTAITRPDIIVSDRELGLIYFLDAEYRKGVDVLRTSDRVIAYTPYAVLRGNLHRGAETRLGDMFDLAGGYFLPMTDVSVFPLINLPAPFPKQADLLIVNHSHINVYHPE